MPDITRETLIDALEQIATLLELKGENPFKIRAYRSGAEVVRTFPGDLLLLARNQQLDGIKGLGEALRDKLHTLAATGSLPFLEELKAEFPSSLFDLFDIAGLGPKKVAALYRELGVASIPDLQRACDDGSLAQLPGFGPKSAANLHEAIQARAAFADTFRLDQVAPAAREILDYLRQHPDTSRAEVAGSFRRGKETVHDLDFLVATPHPQAITEAFIAPPWVQSVIASGPTKTSVRLHSGVQCDLRTVSNAEFPFALAYFTGSKEHNIQLRARALKLGWTLNEYRFSPTSPTSPPPPQDLFEEAEIHRALGLDFIEPALREGSGEIEAAEAHTLPRLVELDNLRGTFHNHTTASDGHASLREMAEAAQELGLQYLGIADHSHSSFQANGLDETRLRHQIAEIRALNAEFAPHFQLLAGSEVDILKDGSLDFPDDLLAELDYVVASVHSSFSLPEAEMTARILRAVQNPYVTILGHLTGRLLLKRPSYPLDIPTILDACAANGTIIELNANPHRLDLDWRWWRLAKEKGVRCAINPDAHTVHGLQDLWYGMQIARKGWLTRSDVVNCLPLSKIAAALAHKRAPSAHP